MEENFATRLKLFIESEGLSSSQFADLCKIPRPTLSQILSGRNKKISDILVGMIHIAFPKLNILWLMFGEGEMYGYSSICHQESNGEEASSTSDRNGAGFQTGPDERGFGSCEVGSASGAGGREGLNGEKSPNLRIENFANTPNRPYTIENSKENSLTQSQNIHNTLVNSTVEYDFKILNLQRQIDEMRQNPRKVTQITIYYDDSTFETFYPGPEGKH